MDGLYRMILNTSTELMARDYFTSILSQPYNVYGLPMHILGETRRNPLWLLYVDVEISIRRADRGFIQRN